MKKFEVAELVALEVESTAFGPQNPNQVDEAKYAVTDEKGNILGWEELYGTKDASNGQN